MSAMMRGFALVLTTGTLALAGCADTTQPQRSAISVQIPTATFAPVDRSTFVNQSLPDLQNGDGINFVRGGGG